MVTLNLQLDLESLSQLVSEASHTGEHTQHIIASLSFVLESS